MKTNAAVAFALVLGSVVTSPALAQQTDQPAGMKSMTGMKGMDMTAMTPAQKEFKEVMDKMDKAMMQGMMDPDPGQSWMKQMAAHHQGAVDMSRVVLKHTKDPVVLKEARKTESENEKNLKELQLHMK